MIDLARVGPLIAQLQGAIGGKKIRGGSGTATWPGGGATSAVVTIPHGLGVAPAAAGAFSQNTLFHYPVTADATNIYVTGCSTNNATISASSRSFYWIALG